MFRKCYCYWLQAMELEPETLFVFLHCPCHAAFLSFQEAFLSWGVTSCSKQLADARKQHNTAVPKHQTNPCNPQATAHPPALVAQADLGVGEVLESSRLPVSGDINPIGPT